MAELALLDTGFLVALINQADPDHARCAASWKPARWKLVTCEGVLVEAAHLLRRNAIAQQGALNLVRAANAEVAAPSWPRLSRAQELMRKYHDLPMDLVDALLVALAEERGISRVLTLDRRGFDTYRIKGRRRFQCVP